MTDTIPAATLVILRERPEAPPEILMVERAARMAFVPGALVFPGGRIDPGDVACAAALAATDMDDAAARVAAIRETIEEVGIAIGLSPTPDSATLAAIRAALHAGDPIAAVIARRGITLDLTALVPFARWRPTHAVSRTFDTRFYLARLPVDSAPARVDRTENVRLFWTTAAAILADADAALIYPTRRNLERLALFSDFADAAADAAAHPVRLIAPVIERRNGIAMLCIPDDLGYPVTAEPLDAVMRG